MLRRKLSKRERRFGFVRFKSKPDAERAIEWMNGFRLYGNRLLVKMAEFEGKKGGRTGNDLASKRNKSHEEFNTYELDVGKGLKQMTKEEGGVSKESRTKKRIIGHIEEEDLWNLRLCLVGTTATVCNVNNIQSRLADWGFGGINVQRLGGKAFF
ncbi:hypothetical protein V6N13_049528 [Hibiscus sabdariffa]